MDNQMYSDIFDIMDKNLKESGGEFSFQKQTFIHSSVHCKPHSADLMDIVNYDNKLFLEVGYRMFLQRSLDQKGLSNWVHKFDFNTDKFQDQLVRTLLSSKEHQETNLRIHNNIFPIKTSPASSKPTVTQTAPAMPNKSFIRRLASKLPVPIKNFIKKILRKK